MSIKITPNPELTERQKKAFADAKKAADDLSTALYNIRYAFYEGGKIPPNGDGVWHHIPDAQGTLDRIRALIKKAEDSALEGA